MAKQVIHLSLASPSTAAEPKTHVVVQPTSKVLTPGNLHLFPSVSATPLTTGTNLSALGPASVAPCVVPRAPGSISGATVVFPRAAGSFSRVPGAVSRATGTVSGAVVAVPRVPGSISRATGAISRTPQVCHSIRFLNGNALLVIVICLICCYAAHDFT